MNKVQKIVVIKSDKKPSQLAQIIDRLAHDGLTFTVYTGDQSLIINLKNSPVKIYKRRGVEHFSTFGDFLMFTLFSPFLWLYLLGRMIALRLQGNKILMLASLPEKLLITPWAWMIGYKIFWLENDFLPNYFRINIYSAIYRIWSNFAVVIPTSEAIKNSLIKEYKVSEKKIKLISQSLLPTSHQAEIFEDIAQREFERKNMALYVIGFVGDLIPENGIEYLIKSTEYFRDFIPQYQIIIVGDGPEKKNLVWLTKMMKLDHQIRFVGRQDNVTKWYPYFDVLALPRISKINFSVTAAESMAAGTPVVACDVPGVSEVVNNQGGVLVEPKNTEALSTAIFNFYHDKALHKQFSAQAKARISNNYNFEKMLEKWKNLILGKV